MSRTRSSSNVGAVCGAGAGERWFFWRSFDLLFSSLRSCFGRPDVHRLTLADFSLSAEDSARADVPELVLFIPTSPVSLS